MNRPKCVDDILCTAEYINQVESENETLKNSVGILKMRLAKQEAETTRLHNIILHEGSKWADHHTDPAKKKYWYDFIRKLSQ
jgi:adenosine/AMP kinase